MWTPLNQQPQHPHILSEILIIITLPMLILKFSLNLQLTHLIHNRRGTLQFG